VLGLGHALKLPVLAEGVETNAELEFLKNESCNEVQGYLVGYPANIEGFRELTHGLGEAEKEQNVIPLASQAAM
jgi:diguanylate cyclase